MEIDNFAPFHGKIEDADVLWGALDDLYYSETWDDKCTDSVLATIKYMKKKARGIR